ncbi:MAG TPA: biotin--[acetyl-CoA-carboxylase] ligase [Candidatus Paceibacterota bacterium]|nr:biotin--[acetyl-CoA-carboxylase] ligase [Candidatus Paceibacterota bacterium]HSA00806.1 biotin--[acetyl-CoA-carboxylase] ligase [Candidatus Paceibacterota bacterium]
MTPDAQILRALRTAKTGAVSGTDLSQRLGISRAAIWARIEELRSIGYDIQAGPHLGYRLISSPDRLHADDLLSRLDPPQIIGRDIRVFQETSSTNDVVEKFGRDGVKEGVVVLAESQTKGRGRLGRKWVSQTGKGLWFSVLLRPDLRPSAATQLTAATAVALTEAIRQATSLQPDIKWPNDLLIGGRKIAGILTELSAELDHIKHLILGIGLNVNQDSGDFPPEIRRTATSLRLASGTMWDRADIAVAILVQLDRIYHRIKKQQFGAIAEEYERQCLTLGHRVMIQTGSRTIQGRAESLDADGALLVRTQHGRLERILGGDVTLEKSS